MSRSQRSSSISDDDENDSQHEIASVDINDALQLAMALAMAEGDENDQENEDEEDDDGIQVLDMDEKDYEEEEDGKEEAQAEAASIEASIDPSSERAQRRRRRQQQASSMMEGVEERSTRRRTTSQEEAMHPFSICLWLLAITLFCMNMIRARLLSLIRRVAATRGHMGSRISRMMGEDDTDEPVEQKVEVLTREEDTSALDEFAHTIQRHTTKGTKNIWSHLPIASTTYHEGSPPHKRAPSKGQHGSILGRYVPNTTTWTEEYQQRAFCGKFSQSGEVFCSASQDGIIHLYDDDFRPIKQIEARDVGWAVVDVDFSADERWVIYSSWSDYVHLCNVHGEYNLHEGLNFAPLGQVCMFGVRFAPNNQDILAGLNHGHIILYDVERKQRLLYARGHDDDINSVCYVDDSSNLFATGSDDAACHIWDKRMLGSSSEGERPHDATPIGGFIGHQHGLTCVASRMDGRYILTNSKDQSMKLWDLRKLASPSELAQHRRHRLASERTIDYRWHRYRRDGTRNEYDHSLMTYLSHTIHQTLVRCDFSPLASTGHRYVYTGSSDSNVYIYDAITGRVVNRLEGHTSIVRDVSWHPYKPMLISSSWDATSRRFEYILGEDGEGDDTSRRSALSRRQQHQAAAHALAQEQARERARRAAEAAAERRRAYRSQVWAGSHQHQHGHEESHQRTRQHDDEEEEEQEEEVDMEE